MLFTFLTKKDKVEGKRRTLYGNDEEERNIFDFLVHVGVVLEYDECLSTRLRQNNNGDRRGDKANDEQCGEIVVRLVFQNGKKK